MKKDEKLSFIISVILNILIVILIPKFSMQVVEKKKIKVGLVNYETKKENPVKKVDNSSMKVEKKNNNKKGITKDELKKISQNIQTPDIEKIELLSKSTLPNRKIEVLKDNKVLKENIIISDDKLENDVKNINIDLEKKRIVENKKLDLKIDENLVYDESLEMQLDFDDIFEEDRVEGLPEGYKLGNLDGDIVAKWDSNNKEPVYPESAQLRGMYGNVKLELSIDEKGNVVKLVILEGSGVPEINNAIEKIGRTWKIYLSKNGLNVKGNVILDYKFVLDGKR